MPDYNMPDDFRGFPWDNDFDVDGAGDWRVAPDNKVPAINDIDGTLVPGTVRECWCSFGNYLETWYIAVYEGCESDDEYAGHIMADVCDEYMNFTDEYGADGVWELICQDGQSMSDFADLAAETSVDFQYYYLEHNAERSWFESEPDW